jgi:hypothetical protein
MATKTTQKVTVNDVAGAAKASSKAAHSVLGIAGKAWSAWQADEMSRLASTWLEDPTPLIDVASDVGKAVVAVNRVAPLFASGATSSSVPLALRLVSTTAATDAGGLVSANQGASLVGDVANAASPLGVATLAVGLVNLGVGVYNAYQIGELRHDVRAMQTETRQHFSEIRSLLGVQSRELAVLLQGQVQLAESVEQLRRDMLTGFKSVLGELGDMESRRRGEELQKMSLQAVSTWQVVLDAVVDGERPSAGDLGRLLAATTELDAWAHTLLEAVPAGSPARLPYFVAKALAARAAADGRSIEAGAPSKQGHREIGRLIAEIDTEVRVLADGKTLYGLGVELAPVIAQYVSLRRGLKAGVDRTLAGDVLAAAGGAPWNDGLADLRLLLSGAKKAATSGDPALVPLGTLDDLRWYLAWSGSDPATTDLRTIEDVELSEVLGSLGANDVAPPEGDDAAFGLLALALPDYRQHAADRLNREFEWSTPMSVVRGSAYGRARAERKTAEPTHNEGDREVDFGHLGTRYRLVISDKARRPGEGAELSRLDPDQVNRLASYRVLAVEDDSIRLHLTSVMPAWYDAEPWTDIEIVYNDERNAVVSLSRPQVKWPENVGGTWRFPRQW